MGWLQSFDGWISRLSLPGGTTGSLLRTASRSLTPHCTTAECTALLHVVWNFTHALSAPSWYLLCRFNDFVHLPGIFRLQLGNVLDQLLQLEVAHHCCSHRRVEPAREFTARRLQLTAGGACYGIQSKEIAAENGWNLLGNSEQGDCS